MVVTAWPSSGKGVWVLEYGQKGYETKILLHLCLNMDERSTIIEKSDGRFYKDPNQCERLRPMLRGFKTET
jgi:hypothetical protein